MSLTGGQGGGSRAAAADRTNQQSWENRTQQLGRAKRALALYLYVPWGLPAVLCRDELGLWGMGAVALAITCPSPSVLCMMDELLSKSGEFWQVMLCHFSLYPAFQSFLSSYSFMKHLLSFQRKFENWLLLNIPEVVTLRSLSWNLAWVPHTFGCAERKRGRVCVSARLSL